ncbi:glycerol-3-phosphate 1-O-acyltransferase PlsY [Clostridium fungisolvens]|uniref:Glycerol-3-phosphate acyltransferase n=1 Tax=Clostridium fungisolvens TaxID=1604897 RepID=A0A6V8SDL0_9CLOT|nr:glycerol-3-phosphate 1-O-acyltransferase PlsY [Clostridium fungisolvens]GFP74786.1 Glycerol-3-phosphate acyltransferase [Clostridium fungisolvens]
MDILISLVLSLIAYLAGSIPTGYILIKKIKGIDIRTVGSGNIGSTNVRRIGGTYISLATQVVDILKGLLPVAITSYLINKGIISINFDKNILLAIVGISAIVGHNYPIFLKFKGGKGVNTTVGVFLFLAPKALIAAAVVFFILKLATSIVSIRSMILAVALIVAAILFRYPNPVVLSTVFTAALLIFRHKANIKRIINGEEK